MNIDIHPRSTNRMFKIVPFACSVLSAFFLWSTLPPLDQSANAWYALVPVILLARFCAPGRAFRFAWLGGFLYWCASLLWLWQLIGNGGPLPLVLLGQFLLSAYMALFWGLFAFASARLWQRANTCHAAWRLPLICLAEPLLWVGTEYLRSHLFTGFPWNLLGVSVSQNLPAIQLASFGGVYAVSSLVFLVNAGLASLVIRIFVSFAKILPASLAARIPNPQIPKLLNSLQSLLPLAFGLAAIMYGVRVIQHELRVVSPDTHDTWHAGLVQPNTPSIFELTDDIVLRQRDELQNLTRQLAALKPDFILWPESAILATLPYDRPAYKLARDAALHANASIITGCAEVRTRPPNHKTYDFYNAMWHFDATGAVRETYHKQHLVPFGEYIPGGVFIPAINKLTPGGQPCTPGQQPGLFSISKRDSQNLQITAGALICFEDLFPHLSRAAIRAGARLLLNATNDAWFEGSLEPEIHLRQSIFRAVETRVPLLRATNTGVTCLVDSLGRVTRLQNGAGSCVSFPGFMNATLSIPRDFAPTPYTRHGDLLLAQPAALFLLLCLLPAAWQWCRRATKKK